MKKFIAILLIFCTVISTFTCTAYGDDNKMTTYNDLPKKDNEDK